MTTTYKFNLAQFCKEIGIAKLHPDDLTVVQMSKSFVPGNELELFRECNSRMVTDLRKLHPADQTDAICLNCVTRDGKQLMYCINQTPAIVAAAVASSPDAWSYVECQTPAMAKLSRAYLECQNRYGKKIANCWDGRSLGKLPQSARHDWKICLAIVLAEGLDSIDLVQVEASEFWDSVCAIYHSALKHHKNPSEEICMNAVMASGLALEHVPIKRMRFDICIAAVMQNPNAVRFVPLEYRNDPTIVYAALFGGGFNRKGVPTTLRYIASVVATKDCRDIIADTGNLCYMTPEHIMDLSQERIYNAILARITGSRSDKIKQICQGTYTAETKTRLLACVIAEQQ
jgi:hypothetical protein